MKILIMGLPGAGKTTLAADVTARLFFNKVVWLNADAVRERFDDWDFTIEGRLRQAYRMRKLADEELSKDRKFVVIDMVAPLKEMRELIEPDLLVWVDTIIQGRFEDTNRMFEPPEYYDLHVTTQDSGRWADIILKKINERKI
jgi:adenylylsulfate kinase